MQIYGYSQFSINFKPNLKNRNDMMIALEGAPAVGKSTTSEAILNSVFAPIATTKKSPQLVHLVGVLDVLHVPKGHKRLIVVRYKTFRIYPHFTMSKS